MMFCSIFVVVVMMFWQYSFLLAFFLFALLSLIVMIPLLTIFAMFAHYYETKKKPHSLNTLQATNSEEMGLLNSAFHMVQNGNGPKYERLVLFDFRCFLDYRTQIGFVSGKWSSMGFTRSCSLARNAGGTCSRGHSGPELILEAGTRGQSGETV